MLKKHSSRSRRCAAAVAEIEWAAAVYGFEIRPVHIRTEDNTIADAGSRRAERDFDEAEFAKLMTQFDQECEERCPRKPPERAPERPDLIPLWQQHVVQLDVWEDEVSIQDKAELEKLLPEYMRCETLASAMRADGAVLAEQRESELRTTEAMDPAAQARAKHGNGCYQRLNGKGMRAVQRE
jgi:hypothetical protein